MFLIKLFLYQTNTKPEIQPDLFKKHDRSYI